MVNCKDFDGALAEMRALVGDPLIFFVGLARFLPQSSLRCAKDAKRLQVEGRAIHARSPSTSLRAGSPLAGENARRSG